MIVALFSTSLVQLFKLSMVSGMNRLHLIHVLVVSEEASKQVTLSVTIAESSTQITRVVGEMAVLDNKQAVE